MFHTATVRLKRSGPSILYNTSLSNRALYCLQPSQAQHLLKVKVKGFSIEIVKPFFRFYRVAKAMEKIMDFDIFYLCLVTFEIHLY